MSRIAILPEQWFGHSEVGADEIAVLAALALHADRSGQCFPTQGLLATLLGRSRPWVNKTIARLVELGLVVRTHRTRNDGGDRSCHYRLVTPDAVSSGQNTGSHSGDSLKTDQELKQETLSVADPIVKSTELRENQDLAAPSLAAEIPDQDWQPRDADLIWAMERFPEADLNALIERFVLRCQAKGYRYRDAGAAWRSWLVDDLGKTGVGRKRQAAPRAIPAAHQRYQAWAGVADRARGCPAA